MGESVALYHWLVVIGCTLVGWMAAMLVMRNFRSRVPYWV